MQSIFFHLLLFSAIQKRLMSDHGPRLFNLTPSRFQWHKFKDSLHFFVMIGAIPAGAVVFLVNIFIGPATLTPIPEGYTPKYWEYHKVRKLLCSLQKFITVMEHLCFSIQFQDLLPVTFILHHNRNMKKCYI